MKKHIRIGKKLFCVSLCGYVLSALSVFVLPLSAGEEAEGITLGAAMVGILFWLGVAIGCLGFFSCWKYICKDKEYYNIRKNIKPAYLNFFRDRQSIIWDSGLVLLWALILVGNHRKVFPDVVMLILMFAGLLTFYLHFLLNGRVFRYLFLRKNL